MREHLDALLGVEEHVRAWHSVLLAVTNEQSTIGVEKVIRWAASERLGRPLDSAFAAFDLDEHADGRFVDRDDAVVDGEFLAVLLVAKPHAESERLENAQRQRPVTDDGL